MSRRTALLILGIAAAITVARIVWLDALPDTGYFLKYVFYANQILAGHVPREQLADLSPAYLLFTIGARAVTTTRWAIRDLQVIMLTIAALLIGAAAWRMRGMVAGSIAAAIVLLNRAALVNASDFEPETLLLLFVAAALLFLVLERPLLAGIFCGLGAVTRPVVLLPALLIAAFYLWRRRGAAALRLAGGTAIPVAIVLAAHLMISGTATIMDPGTVFFEGMNPLATGYVGIAPRVVKEIEPSFGFPDAMHEAYRTVASRAAGRPLPRSDSNRYWTSKALAFVRWHPSRAVALTWRKLTFLFHGYDAWDVPSMTAMDGELRRVPLWISFALIIPLAIAGFVLFRRPDVALFALGSALPLVIFFVNGRQRQPLLAAAAIGCGLAAAEIVARRRMVIAVIVIAFAALLSIEGPQQDQDAWIASAILRADDALRRNDVASAATWMPDLAPYAPPAALRAVALNALATDRDASRQFAAGICLLRAGERATAARVFDQLARDGYHAPWQNHAVSSVAYYQGRYEDARREAPGDPDVLAACAASGDRAAGAELDALWDPLTASAARRNTIIEKRGVDAPHSVR